MPYTIANKQKPKGVCNKQVLIAAWEFLLFCSFIL